MIVQAALQEGVDIIGLSILSGAHVELCSRVLKLLKEKGLDKVAVIVGGIIPRDDVPVLKEMGVKEAFGPGTDPQRVLEFVQGLAGTEAPA